MAQRALDLIKVRGKIDYTSEELTKAKDILREVYSSHTSIELQVSAFNKLVLLEDNNTATELVSNALYSSNTSFKTAAISQITRERFNTEDNKSVLIDVVADEKSAISTVSAAINTLLTSFDLDEQERQRLISIRNNNPNII